MTDRFCRLNQHRARNDQWKIDRHRMKTVVDQSLGNVECVYAFAGLALVGENHFVHGCALERLFVFRDQTVGDVARVEYGRFRCFAQTIPAMRENVSQCAQHHSIVSEECFHATDGLRVIEIELVSWIYAPVATAPGSALARFCRRSVCDDYSRNWKKRLEFFGTATRPATRSAAAVGRGKSFVQIQMRSEEHTSEL